MNILQQPLGTLARTIPGATRLFYQHRLDFCCGGHESLQDAAICRGLNPKAIAAQLNTLQQTKNTDQVVHQVTPETLIPHILERYHKRHREQLPELVRLAARVELVHREHPDCPRGLSNLLTAIHQELESHMLKEENVLFPMLLRHLFDHAINPIAMMRFEHDQHGQSVKQIEQLTHNLTPPDDACDTWQALYWQLDWFRADLMEHIHLENNLLFELVDAQGANGHG